jgi:outer membrane protein TolC
LLSVAASAAAQAPQQQNQPAARQQSPSPSAAPSPPISFAGATRHGDERQALLPLSLSDAITRGLEYNVGLFLTGKLSDQARAARLQQLSNLLPTLDATLRESRQKTNLQALGINFPGVPQAVEFPNFDARVSVTAPLLDLHALSNARAASQSVAAADWDTRNARESVVLAIASAYLQAVSAAAAKASADADLATAQALFEIAGDRERSGVSPNIDTLRAEVEMHGRQQAVTRAQNTLDKQRVALLRIVGLPLGQAIALTSEFPYKAHDELSAHEAFDRAIAARTDYKAADEQVHAAESSQHAAVMQHAPTVEFNGDYGALGTEPSNAIPTWSATGLVRLPIFDGRRIEAAIAQADAVLQQRRAERDDLRIAIEQDVTNAVLDVQSASDQVRLAAATVELARQTLTEAQDRFSAGVTNNIEVIQAQDALVNANNQYIGALEAHNLAKLMLARAMGSAEQTWKTVLAQ